MIMINAFSMKGSNALHDSQGGKTGHQPVKAPLAATVHPHMIIVSSSCLVPTGLRLLWHMCRHYNIITSNNQRLGECVQRKIFYEIQKL